jgi:translation initiation factor IF-2
MTGTDKPVRLSKAAREFNVSLDTIVDFLDNLGFEVERNPNSKLTPEMYTHLTGEFAEEKHVKEIAKKKGLEYLGKQTISIDDVKEKTEKEPAEDFIPDEIMITDKGVRYEAEKPVEEKKPEPVAKVEKPVEVKKPTPPVVEKEPEKVKEKEIVEEAEKVEEKAEEKVKTEVKEEPVVSAEKDTATEEKTEEQKPAEEGNQLKVLGKVDLDSINQKTRPRKLTKAEKAKEAAAKKKAAAPAEPKKEEKKKEEVKVEKPIAETKKELEKPVEEVKQAEEKKSEDPKEKDNFIPTKFQKLAGPTVVDKIELPKIVKPTKKKPVASSSDDKVGQNKKKRKRIRTAAQPSTPQSGDKKPRSGQQDRGRGKKREAKPELTEEQIQKQIKETLARLASPGKSRASKHRRQKRDSVYQSTQEDLERLEAEKSVLKVTEFVTANDLSSLMNVSVTDIISTCMQIGMFVSINQRLDAETIVLVAEEFGYKVEFVGVDDSGNLEVEEEIDDPESLVERAPIVTVMGHVDHGKTKLLDYIRKANVVAGEAGGITQHIGAYAVKTESGKKITFLDTPGHEAFTAMRARGAKVTDIAIIVIAADDSVMPQTKEAINHAQAAGVPIVFAFNKMDKPGASADKIREQLSTMNILVEEWGGKYQTQEISALKGDGIDDLLEKVLLEAEMLELKANPDKAAKGTVIEATLDKGRGYVTTILVQEGSLSKGDILLAGPIFGKVRAMTNEHNKTILKAGPSTPVVLLGLNSAAQSGDIFNVMLDEKEAKNLASKRQQLLREQNLRTQRHITLDEIGRRIAIGDFKELNVIVKGDVDGSVEALSDELLKLSTEEVQVNVIHKAVGAITETDVTLASASNAIIIGFQVRPVPQARKAAEKEQIDIRLYSVIYKATEELKLAIKGMLSPVMEEKIVCNIEVRETFRITKVGTIAGCYVLDGKINRNTNVRLIRDGIVVYTGKLGSLKRFKDDVKEVSSGYECGLNIENFNDIKVGDIVEGYEVVEVAR